MTETTHKIKYMENPLQFFAGCSVITREDQYIL